MTAETRPPPRTTFAPGFTTLWPDAPQRKQKGTQPRTTVPTDLGALRIVRASGEQSAPSRDRRPKSRSQYSNFFALLEFGDYVECRPEDAGRVAVAMRAWLTQHQLPGRVRKSTSHAGSASGARVQLLAPRPPRA